MIDRTNLALSAPKWAVDHASPARAGGAATGSSGGIFDQVVGDELEQAAHLVLPVVVSLAVVEILPAVRAAREQRLRLGRFHLLHFQLEDLIPQLVGAVDCHYAAAAAAAPVVVAAIRHFTKIDAQVRQDLAWRLCCAAAPGYLAGVMKRHRCVDLIDLEDTGDEGMAEEPIGLLEADAVGVMEAVLAAEEPLSDEARALAELSGLITLNSRRIVRRLVLCRQQLCAHRACRSR